jgi:membrane protease YdiL (CAAX protease family)
MTSSIKYFNFDSPEPINDCNYIKKSVKTGLKQFYLGVMAGAVVDGVFGYKHCPNLPKSIYLYAKNICLLKEYIPLRGNFAFYAIKSPISEELIFRVLIQQGILKKLPEAILNRFASSYTHLIDEKITKAARIALAALAFSLAHAISPEVGWPNCSTFRLVNSFAIGLFLGKLQEETDSPLAPIILHMCIDLLPAIVASVSGVSVGCPSIN